MQQPRWSQTQTFYKGLVFPLQYRSCMLRAWCFAQWLLQSLCGTVQMYLMLDMACTGWTSSAAGGTCSLEHPHTAATSALCFSSAPLRYMPAAMTSTLRVGIGFELHCPE